MIPGCTAFSASNEFGSAAAAHGSSSFCRYVRLFTLDGGEWTQAASEIGFKGANGNFRVLDVELSTDSTTIAVSGRDSQGLSVAHVYHYEVSKYRSNSFSFQKFFTLESTKAHSHINCFVIGAILFI